MSANSKLYNSVNPFEILQWINFFIKEKFRFHRVDRVGRKNQIFEIEFGTM